MTGSLARRKTMLAVAAFVALVVAYPLVIPGNYPLGVGITAGAMAAGTVGFVLLFGYAQQLALGQAGFCMVGGYANAILCVRYHWDPFVALLVGSVLAMAVAYVIAAPILKLRGFVLAMASLALQFILIVAALQLPFTGGALGTYGLPKFAIFGATLQSDLGYYYVIWFIVLLAVAVGLNIDRSRIGRALKAIAVSEMAAGSVGIDIAKYKVQMFVVSAGMASVSGSLTVHFLRAMDPEVFGFAYSLNIITSVIVGGLMSIWGGAMGAAIVTGVREVLRGLSLPLWEAVIMGALDRDRADRVSARARGLHQRPVRPPGRRARAEARARRRAGADRAQSARRPAARRYADPRGRGRAAFVRQPARRRRRELHRRGRLDHHAHRPERRRQDHHVQPGRRLSAARQRQRHVPGRSRSRRSCRTTSRCAASAGRSRTCSSSTT